MKELEDIIEEVGGQGCYQKRLLYFVLSPLFLLLPLSFVAEVFYLSVPNHWCYHPMTTDLNKSELEAWKKCFLTEKEDGSYESCQILLPNMASTESFWNMNFSRKTLFDDTCSVKKWESIDGYNNEDIVNGTCEKGWMFDDSEFIRTIPMDQQWVCESGHQYVAQLFFCGMAGSTIGGVLFSSIADRFGRRITLLIITVLSCVFMTSKTFLSDQYWCYVVLKISAYACLISVFRLPGTLAAEISNPFFRSWTIFISYLMW